MSTAIYNKKSFNYGQLFSLTLLCFAVVVGLKLFGTDVSETVFRLKCIYLLIVDIFYIVLWINKTHKVNSLFFYFLLYFIVTNGGVLFINGVDWSSEIGFFASNKYPLHIMDQALDYQLICTVIFVSVGIMCSNSRFVTTVEEKKPFKVIANGRIGKMTTVDWLFIIISLIYMSLCFQGISMRSGMSYGDYYYDANKVSISLLIKYSFYVTMYYSLYKHISNDDGFRNIVLLVDIVLSLLLLLLGSRNEIIPMVFGVAFAFGRAGYKLSKRQSALFIVYVVLFLMLMGVVPLLRQMSISSLNTTTASEAFTGFGVLLSFLGEMGGSLRTTTETMMMIDSGTLSNEQTILYTLLFGICPSQSVLNVLSINMPQNWSLATWVTDLNGGGSGWGFSMLAESYYNYSGYGYLWFIVWAYLFVGIENIVDKTYRKGNLLLSSAWLYVGAYAIFLARADTCLIALALRYTMYITILFFVFRNVKTKQ